MLSIPVPAGSPKIDKVLNGLWSEKDADTDRKKENREEILSSVRSLYANRKNAGGFGYNGWSLFNAVGEYYDHHWFDDEARNAAASMQIGNKSHLVQFLEQVSDQLNPNAKKIDGFDNCIVGVGNQYTKEPLLIYDEMLIWEQLVDEGMEPEEAWDHMAFNIAGAWVGEGTPIIMSHVNDH